MAARLVKLLPPSDEGARASTPSAPSDVEPNDAELVARACAGDSWAQEALYRRHAHAVTRAVIRLVGRDDDADDIIQDAFVHAFQRLDTLRDGGAFRTWIARIAFNRVRGRARRRKILSWVRFDRSEPGPAFVALAVHGSRPDLYAELAELDGILRGVPDEPRMVWLLHRVEGWSLQETSDAVGCSTATVKRRLSAADALIDLVRSGRTRK